MIQNDEMPPNLVAGGILSFINETVIFPFDTVKNPHIFGEQKVR